MPPDRSQSAAGAGRRGFQIGHGVHLKSARSMRPNCCGNRELQRHSHGVATIRNEAAPVLPTPDDKPSRISAGVAVRQQFPCEEGLAKLPNERCLELMSELRRRYGSTLIRIVLMRGKVTARLRANLAGCFKAQGGRRQDEKCSGGAKSSVWPCCPAGC
jgi:hypothetical protein